MYHSSLHPVPPLTLPPDLPRHLRRWHPRDLEHLAGRLKAARIVAWLAEIGGSGVVAFPINRRSMPATERDPATGRCRRVGSSGARA